MKLLEHEARSNRDLQGMSLRSRLRPVTVGHLDIFFFWGIKSGGFLYFLIDLCFFDCSLESPFFFFGFGLGTLVLW